MITKENQTVHLNYIPAGAKGCDIIDFFSLMTLGGLPLWRIVLFCLEFFLLVLSFVFSAAFLCSMRMTVSISQGFKALCASLSLATFGCGACRLMQFGVMWSSLLVTYFRIAVIIRTFTTWGNVPFLYMLDVIMVQLSVLRDHDESASGSLATDHRDRQDSTQPHARNAALLGACVRATGA